MLVYLSLGSNLGNREATLDQAVELIQKKVGTLLKRSTFFYSKPWRFVSNNDFCNICISIETELSPLDVLHVTQAIERSLGRLKRYRRDTDEIPCYSDRTIDIDLLEYFDENGKKVIINTPELTLPHPLMQKRDFVMIPLQEIVIR